VGVVEGLPGPHRQVAALRLDRLLVVVRLPEVVLLLVVRLRVRLGPGLS